MDYLSIAKKIMTEFADSTGLSKTEKPPRRYLWTDAFAVCNYFELHHLTGEDAWRQSALNLIEQVHSVLGRHREDDERSGWISGLGEAEGGRHPTIGGLRIGKKKNERKLEELYDDRAEWDRDGQYYHYLTKWMHALNRASRSTVKPIFNSWAIELAKNVHAAFIHILPSGAKRMYWKMSIDLSRPLVGSMGQHDPLDGLITYRQLLTTAREFPDGVEADLDSEIAEMEALCKGQNWVTQDPLGIGGLLGDACRAIQLIMRDGFAQTELLSNLLESSILGLDVFTRGNLLELPAEYRLGFRELGLSIGLHAVEKMKRVTVESPDVFPQNHSVHEQIDRLACHVPLMETIEQFWLKPVNRNSSTWTEHGDINSVMLATSLIPDGYLQL